MTRNSPNGGRYVSTVCAGKRKTEDDEARTCEMLGNRGPRTGWNRGPKQWNVMMRSTPSRGAVGDINNAHRVASGAALPFQGGAVNRTRNDHRYERYDRQPLPLGSTILERTRAIPNGDTRRHTHRTRSPYPWGADAAGGRRA